jgi:hypothetical protein
MIWASLNRPFFIKNLVRYLAEKILLLNTINFRGGTHQAMAFKGVAVHDAQKQFILQKGKAKSG